MKKEGKKRGKTDSKRIRFVAICCVVFIVYASLLFAEIFFMTGLTSYLSDSECIALRLHDYPQMLSYAKESVENDDKPAGDSDKGAADREAEMYDQLDEQLLATMDGHIVHISPDGMRIYPEDEEKTLIIRTLDGAIKRGEFDLNALEQIVETGEKDSIINIKMAFGAKEGEGALKYIFFIGAFRGIDENVCLVRNFYDVSRLGNAATISFWYLCVLISIILVVCICKTKLLTGEEHIIKKSISSLKKAGVSALLFASLLMVVCTVILLELNSASITAYVVDHEAAYISEQLKARNKQTKAIEKRFHEDYKARATEAAAMLDGSQERPSLAKLREIDDQQKSDGLCVYDLDGNLLAADTDALRDPAEDGKVFTYVQPYKGKDGTTAGFAELLVDKRRLQDKLDRVDIQALVDGEANFERMSIAVVDSEDMKVIAATEPVHPGDAISQYGIEEEFLRNEYEGYIEWDGANRYTKVFMQDENYIIIGHSGSEDSMMVFLTIVTGVLLVFTQWLFCYIPFVLIVARRQEKLPEDRKGFWKPDREYPPLAFFIYGLMAGVFILNIFCIRASEKDPGSMLYRLVSGGWNKGVNIFTITICITLTSTVMCCLFLFHIFLTKLMPHLNSRGRTICQLCKSISTYMALIILFFYLLSMLGVNTTALMTSAGILTLVVGMGANSMIADVLAGLFIIFEGNYVVGDEVELSGFSGTVIDIGVRTTKLKALDSDDIKIINNSRIGDIVNKSKSNKN